MGWVGIPHTERVSWLVCADREWHQRHGGIPVLQALNSELSYPFAFFERLALKVAI